MAVLPKEFATAIGITTLQLGRIEQLSLVLLLQLPNDTGGIVLDSEVETRKILKETFKPRLDRIKSKLEALNKASILLEDEWHQIYHAIEVRNFVVHGL